MSNKKQTAVEWLKHQLEYFGNKHELQMSWETLDELFEQAKEMEKEQIIYAYMDSTSQFSNDARIDYPKTAKQYYKETYNK